MATHSSVLAWRISGTGEPSGLPSMGLHRVGHDWSDLAAAGFFNNMIFTLHLTNIFISRILGRTIKWVMYQVTICKSLFIEYSPVCFIVECDFTNANDGLNHDRFIIFFFFYPERQRLTCHFLPPRCASKLHKFIGWHHWLDGLWASFGSWWWTGKPEVLQSTGLQKVRPNWVTELTVWSMTNHVLKSLPQILTL